MVPPGATVRGGGGEHKKVEVGLREGRWVGQNWKKKKKVGYGLFRRKKRDRTREKKDESQEEESKSVRREAREKKG